MRTTIFPLLLVLLAVVVWAQTPPPARNPLPAHRIYTGETKAMGDGTLTAWVDLNPAGHPQAIGVSFTAVGLATLPALDTEWALALPPQAAETPFTHLGVNWNPHGHIPPGIYDVPHFDFHFYTITPEARNRITLQGADLAKAQKAPPPAYVPPGYIAAPGGEEPIMGAHWADPNSPEFHGTPFTASFIHGYYNGQLAFLEPMVTLAWLQTRPNFTAPVPQPAKVAKPGYYPTQYTVTYDAARQVYTLALTGLTARK